MARKSNTISILQFDAKQFSRLRFRPTASGIAVLSHSVRFGDWSADPEALGAALDAYIKEEGGAEDSFYTLLPRHEITTRVLRFPTHDPQELGSMIRFSAEEYVPFSADELIIDQCILREFPSGECEALVALAHQDIVESHLAVLRVAGIEPLDIFLSTGCLMAATKEASSRVEHPMALVHLASTGMEVAVLKGGRFYYGRGVAATLDWQGEESEAGEELIVELRGSLAAYRRESESGEEVSQIWLSGAGIETKSYAEGIFHELGRECSSASFLSALLDEGSASLEGAPLIALGAALTAQGRGVKISLLPERLTQGRALDKQKFVVLRYAVLAAVLILALVGFYWQALHQREELIEDLEAQVARVAPKAKGVSAKQEQLRILRQQVARSGSALELLAEVCQAAPKEVLNLTRFTYYQNEGINLWGHAKTVDDVHIFAQKLRNASQAHMQFFAEARSLYEQEGWERGKRVFNYQIAIPKPEEEDADEAS